MSNKLSTKLCGFKKKPANSIHLNLYARKMEKHTQQS